MEDSHYAYINCLQWGFAVLPPEKTTELLAKFTEELSSSAYDIICEAHSKAQLQDNWGWWNKLCSKIGGERERCFNFGVGRKIIPEYHPVIIAVFATWEDYEDFREALREETKKWFESNQTGE